MHTHIQIDRQTKQTKIARVYTHTQTQSFLSRLSHTHRTSDLQTNKHADTDVHTRVRTLAYAYTYTHTHTHKFVSFLIPNARVFGCALVLRFWMDDKTPGRKENERQRERDRERETERERQRENG